MRNGSHDLSPARTTWRRFELDGDLPVETTALWSIQNYGGQMTLRSGVVIISQHAHVDQFETESPDPFDHSVERGLIRDCHPQRRKAFVGRDLEIIESRKDGPAGFAAEGDHIGRWFHASHNL